MSKIPFSNFDWIVIIAPFFGFIVGIDYTVGDNWLDGANLTIAGYAKWIILMYMGGQIFHFLSVFFLETLLTKKVVGNPVVILLTASEPTGFKSVLNFILGEFLQPFSQEILFKLNTKMKKEDIPKNSEAKFQYIFNTIKFNREVMERINSFALAYGIFRNLSFSALVTSSFAFEQWISGHKNNSLYVGILSLIVSVVMFTRFTKLFRQYAKEVFLSYLVIHEELGSSRRAA